MHLEICIVIRVECIRALKSLVEKERQIYEMPTYKAARKSFIFEVLWCHCTLTAERSSKIFAQGLCLIHANISSIDSTSMNHSFFSIYLHNDDIQSSFRMIFNGIIK